MPQEYRNFIGGEWTPASSGNTTKVRNPADTDEVIGIVADLDGRGCARGDRRQARGLPQVGWPDTARAQAHPLPRRQNP